VVAGHGVRHVLLASRGGEQAGGAAGLAAELAALGARVKVAACDVADRDEVRRLLSCIPRENPLTAVVHAADVLDDGLIGTQSSKRIDVVLRPKLDTAWYLHELTAGMDLAAFVLFSSAAGTLGSPGQGNYAAANAGLDALAEYRRTLGLPAISLAWGLWERRSGMTAHLSDTDLERMARAGMPPLSQEQGLALLDRAVASDAATVVALRLDTRRLRASDDPVPPLLHGLVPVRYRRASAALAGTAAGTNGLAERLAVLPGPERRRLLADIVTTQAQIVLGHTNRTAIDARRTFRDMGVDSLTAVELRNRLAAETGLQLPPTVIFDQPTIDQIAEMLDAELGGARDAARPDADGESRTGDVAADLVARMYRQSLEAGEVKLGNSMLMSLAHLRPTFEDPADLERIPQPTPLVDPGAAARLVFFNPVAPLNGSSALSVLAQKLPGQLRVSALASPGFGSEEKMPATGTALISMHADTITDFVGDTPFLLGGHSSGGLIAYEVARELIARGKTPRGLILLDTYTAHKFVTANLETVFTQAVFAQASKLQIPIDGYRLSAAVWINTLFRDWEPVPLPVPSLLVRATHHADADADDWQTSMDYISSTVDVPGNHFSIVNEYAESTAQAIGRWLEEHVELPVVAGGSRP
jgi:thioesterase domain-containing protein/acyl carrier protein